MTYKKHEREDLVEASNYYLTESLPSNFHKWKEKKLDQFIEDHLWQPFENEQVDVVWDHITCLANGIRSYIKFDKERNNEGLDELKSQEY